MKKNYVPIAIYLLKIPVTDDVITSSGEYEQQNDVSEWFGFTS